MRLSIAEVDAVCEFVPGAELRAGDSLQVLGKFHRIAHFERLHDGVVEYQGPTRMVYVEGDDRGFMTVADNGSYRIAKRACGAVESGIEAA